MCIREKRRVHGVKKISKDNFLPERRPVKEIAIMKQLEHPNIVRLHETISHALNIYLVMDLCSGGDLFDKLFDLGRICESDGPVLMQQIFCAVAFLHGKHIAHRDLKPDNFMLTDHNDAVPLLKLIDFGFACKYSSENPIMHTRVGTSYYVAPQVLQGEYDNGCDVWSCGVILYTLLCSYPPFNAETDEQVLKLVRIGKYSFPDKDWKRISESCKELIRMLMKMNPKERLTAEQALQHAWVVQAGAPPSSVDTGAPPAPAEQQAAAVATAATATATAAAAAEEVAVVVAPLPCGSASPPLLPSAPQSPTIGLLQQSGLEGFALPAVSPVATPTSPSGAPGPTPSSPLNAEAPDTTPISAEVLAGEAMEAAEELAQCLCQLHGEGGSTSAVSLSKLLESNDSPELLRFFKACNLDPQDAHKLFAVVAGGDANAYSVQEAPAMPMMQFLMSPEPVHVPDSRLRTEFDSDSTDEVALWSPRVKRHRAAQFPAVEQEDVKVAGNEGAAASDARG
eukprot:NODE_1968_length_2322_cov_6.963098.p1 GENE.NODE_1968_length_2322_cov_6.963098~~NODE_1968_length_2322_cov_6.963098.p1  ORF type:complete len:510 (+),score=101.16 NODE_1968_length_2322_cov_6.963098:121-1650(+)